MAPLTIELVEMRLGELQPVIDGVVLDLHNADIENVGDLDPEEFPEAERHYILAWNRALQFKAELARAGIAIDPDWTPPQTDTTRFEAP